MWKIGRRRRNSNDGVSAPKSIASRRSSNRRQKAFESFEALAVVRKSVWIHNESALGLMQEYVPDLADTEWTVKRLYKVLQKYTKSVTTKTLTRSVWAGPSTFLSTVEKEKAPWSNTPNRKGVERQNGHGQVAHGHVRYGRR